MVVDYISYFLCSLKISILFFGERKMVKSEVQCADAEPKTDGVHVYQRIVRIVLLPWYSEETSDDLDKRFYFAFELWFGRRV